MSQTREELEVEAKICHDSIEWWKKEMSSLINKTELLEAKGEDHPDFEIKMDQIRTQMNYLIHKGRWENQQIFELQKRINKFETEKAFGNFKLIEKKKKKK